MLLLTATLAVAFEIENLRFQKRRNQSGIKPPHSKERPQMGLPDPSQWRLAIGECRLKSADKPRFLTAIIPTIQSAVAASLSRLSSKSGDRSPSGLQLFLDCGVFPGCRRGATQNPKRRQAAALQNSIARLLVSDSRVAGGRRSEDRSGYYQTADL